MPILVVELLYALFLHQVLKCLNQFVQNFPGLVESQFMGKLLSKTYQVIMVKLALFEQM